MTTGSAGSAACRCLLFGLPSSARLCEQLRALGQTLRWGASGIREAVHAPPGNWRHSPLELQQLACHRTANLRNSLPPTGTPVLTGACDYLNIVQMGHVQRNRMFRLHLIARATSRDIIAYLEGVWFQRRFRAPFRDIAPLHPKAVNYRRSFCGHMMNTPDRLG
ncbi:hypothetical protein SNOG_05257 [Parastagonospora nodorum SN15]|uniref:Uncharacterized protein n=1 Tax=Phaeosphaeria nodorum (strain SN15 / ATCC MYA-4574 / FGSC 10173) TaxID=321614 RepID=Q0USK7_PHANO|nr:hypothetical protein SNOG_05257 [Parastagonospora nodorum SN15]EAT87648.1 hypothetical protein SNOG_05257 [Parastagonospora nodorum SN15]